ncbi:MAG: TolC family protein [Verrucomicrobia bacterium]|nr:TolC family protein [Verrucomicrobiota bacterium]
MHRHLVRALLLLSLSSTCALAQPKAQAPGSAPAILISPDKPFSLEEAMALALQKSFSLQIQAITRDNSKENVKIQEAGFDPTLTANITRSVNQSASTTSRLDGTATQGPRTDNTVMRAGVSLPRITATNATLSVTTNVSRAATNSTNALFNPAYNNGVSANLTQPLLSNFGRQAAMAALDTARLAFGIATTTYKSNVLTTVANTENAYYNLVAAREAFRIAQLSLDANQRLFDENKARRSTGVMTDLDVLSAEVGVARARNTLVQREQAVRDAEERLLNVINAGSFDVRPGPVAFDPYNEGKPNFAQSYKLAREFFPDTLSQEQTIKQMEIALTTAKRSALPDLDLVASVGYSARTTSANYGQAIANLPNDHGNNWALGLNYSMPWGQQADKARLRQAANNLSSSKIRLEQLEAQLMLDVRIAVRAVETNLVAVEIAAKATELAARQYDQQKARFDAGLSTSRIVLQFQDDLESARNAELTAKLALRRAVSDLRRLEGTSLQRFKVQLPE